MKKYLLLLTPMIFACSDNVKTPEGYEVAKYYTKVVLGEDTCSIYKVKSPGYNDLPIMTVVKCEGYNSNTFAENKKHVEILTKSHE